jgi:hypothetical protein
MSRSTHGLFGLAGGVAPPLKTIAGKAGSHSTAQITAKTHRAQGRSHKKGAVNGAFFFSRSSA